MTQKQKRVTNLSTRWLMPFKFFMYAVYTSFFIWLIFYVLRDHWFIRVVFTGQYGYGLYLAFRMAAKLKQVEFDDTFLYMIQRKQDILIPLENIESVEISSLGGVYKVNLYTAEQSGKFFYFKPSLLYPLNYKKKDELVNVLRSNIDKAKKKRQEVPLNALMS